MGEPARGPEMDPKYLHRNRFKIVTRSEWEAVTPERSYPLATPATEVLVVSETGSDWCYTMDECSLVMRKLQKQHMNEGHDDIQYNFLIGTDDRTYEGTGWQTAGAKIPGHEDLDKKAISIAYLGVFEDWPKSQRLRENVDALLKFGVENNFISADYNRTEVNVGKGEINYVLDFIEDRTDGKRSLYESPYLSRRV